MKGNLWMKPLACALVLSGTLWTSLHAVDEAPVVRPAGKESKLTVGGMLQVQGEFGEAGDSRFTTNDRILLRRARVNVQGGVLEGFDFRLEMDLGGAGSSLRAQITDGYVVWTKSKILNVRAGQFKTPFGFEQLVPDPVLFTIERSLANDRLTSGRQLGVQVSATRPDKRLSVAAGFFNGNGVNNGSNDNGKFFYAGRVTVVAVQTKWIGKDIKWSVGADAYASEDAGLSMSDLGFKGNLFSGKRAGIGLDTQIHLGLFDLWTEYLRGRFRPIDKLPAEPLTSEGWYAQGSWYLVPKRFQALAKYETFDGDAARSGTSTDTWLVGLNYYIKDHDLKLQLDYQRSDASGLSSEENRLFTRLQVVF